MSKPRDPTPALSLSERRPLRALTGVKPTGVPHIGNYLGAIRPALELAKAHESFFFIADLHALTTQRDPKQLEEETFSVAATWLSLGLDPSRTVFYRQSDVPETATLAWILSCFTPFGLLNRAHSMKELRQNQGQSDDDINHGVFAYPVLMAADILLYDADVVPVGKDQKQHLEITQEIARKLNNEYGPILKVPEARIDERVMTIPGLDGRKMSKSYANDVSLFGTDKELKKKLMSIKTDSTELGQPLDSTNDTIFQIYALFATEAEREGLLAKYRTGRQDASLSEASLADPTTNYFGWGHAKKALLDMVLDRLGPARAEYTRLMADKGHILKLLGDGAERARVVAESVLRRVEDAVGIRNPSRRR
ncbi:MAG: tryptophan--tRNA ligase [Deltaproteobacteria bacterium]|nr:tryptophan--tRNA ligase [Deltaproteobacteria bacterium]